MLEGKGLPSCPSHPLSPRGKDGKWSQWLFFPRSELKLDVQLSRINSVLPASLAVAVILGWVLAKEMGAEISKATPRNLRMSQLTPALYLFLLPPCCLDGDVVVHPRACESQSGELERTRFPKDFVVPRCCASSQLPTPRFLPAREISFYLLSNHSCLGATPKSS